MSGSGSCVISSTRMPSSGSAVRTAALAGLRAGAYRTQQWKAGAYAAADSYFVLLEFDDESNLWPVVYIEGLTDNQYLQRGSDIARYRETVEYLRDRALDPGGSTEFMENVRKEYGRGD